MERKTKNSSMHNAVGRMASAMSCLRVELQVVPLPPPEGAIKIGWEEGMCGKRPRHLSADDV